MHYHHFIFIIITLIQVIAQDVSKQNVTTIVTSMVKLSLNEKMKKYVQAALLKQNKFFSMITSWLISVFIYFQDASKTDNFTMKNTISNKITSTPPDKIFHEYLRCRQLSSINQLPSSSACPYEFEENIRVCWKASENGTYAYHTMEYDHGLDHFYDGVHSGIENCTIQRFCQNNGTWARTVPLEIQCQICFGDGRPVKFNSISIMIETMSLSLSLISLTIAVLCMINVKRLHLPRNLLHMHLFVAFIFRSIIKLVFIHLIIGGYTRTMIMYSYDKCGNVEILSKSSHWFHVLGCRILSSLFWYTDAVSQTFIFCEATFLFTALTSHLFRDRGCLLFVLWGWLSPLVWLTMWVASHIITDQIKNRSTCWLEADNTTYFYYFFYVPYAFYLLINFGIFLYLVRLLYSKYQSSNSQTNRSGNRHLIKSILILIPLFGLHSLFVMWVFYHKNQGHTIWYYIAVIFKAIFGDLQGFFTSLIYFYFNTEIRHEVLRQVQRSLLRHDTVRRSSAGETLTTRLSVFRISTNRRRQSSIPNRHDKRRITNPSTTKSISKTRPIRRRKFLAYLCPCLIKENPKSIIHKREYVQQPIDIINIKNDMSPGLQTNLTSIDDRGGLTSTLILPIDSNKAVFDNDGLTSDTMIIKNNHGNDDDDILSDENDVTFHHTSFNGEQTSLMSTPTLLLTRNTPREIFRHRSKNDGQTLKALTFNCYQEQKPSI